jgi:hypothetical protein
MRKAPLVLCLGLAFLIGCESRPDRESLAVSASGPMVPSEDALIGEGRSLGIVKLGRFLLLLPRPLPGVTRQHASPGIRLTSMPMQAAMAPEAHELDLRDYEGKAILVEGHVDGGWIYDARIVDCAGDILTAVVRKVFADQGDEQR